MEEKIELNKDTREIMVKNIVIKSDELFELLESSDNMEEAFRKAVAIGALGIRYMGTGAQMDYVDRKFSEFMSNMKRQFDEQHTAVKDLINETFDEDNTKSPMFKFAKNLETYFNDKTGVVRTLINETFDPSNTKSPMGTLVKNLDSYFNEDGTINQLLSTHFDMDNKKSSMSQFANMLEQNFDVDKGAIRHLLDPNKPGSPVSELRDEMIKNFNDVREKMVSTRAEQAILEKSTQKGGVFEDFVYDLLHDITNNHGDTIENSKNKIGKLQDRKVGDFVVHMKDGDEHMVVEAKDSTKHSIPEVLEEIRDAIENRGAKFGIYIFKSADQMPPNLRPCRIERNYIITSADGGGLYYAYHVARTIINSERAQNGASIPIDKIRQEVEHLVKKNIVIGKTIKNAQKISKHAGSIEESLQFLQTEIDDSLKRIQEHLKS